MIITIDGPSGTGKSTIAKALAKALGFYYCNTGIMYRALAYAHSQPPWHQQSIEQLLLEAPITFSFDHEGLKAFLADRHLHHELFTQETTSAVQHLATLAPVRAFVQELQRQYAQKGNCIFDGRDMGSKVFPHAELKIFLTASPEIRALRRLKDFSDPSLSQEEVMQALIQRDEEDQQRALDPLVIPEGAVVLDSSDLSITEVLEKILSCIPVR